MEKKKLAEKANSYAKYVREMYAPPNASDLPLKNNLEEVSENYPINNAQ